MKAVECKGGCGVVFCSTRCMEAHQRYGHHHACEHVRKSRAGGDNNYYYSKQETKEELASAKAILQKNQSWPAVVWKGTASTRRFRPGQRVLACVTGGFKPGTIVKLEFQPAQDCLLAYEIEADNGVYCSASLDNDDFVRRLPGAPVVGDHSFPLKEEMLPAVVSEFQNWMPHCQEARTDASTLKGPPAVDKYRCSACGKTSKIKLFGCSRCRTVAYCGASCQEKNWSEHKVACKRVAKSRAEFLAEHGDKLNKRQRKQSLRHGSRAQLRWETLRGFLMNNGLPYGAAHFLQTTVDRAAEASESPDGTRALRQLAETEHHGSDIAHMMSGLIFTSENLVLLVAGVLHFFDTAPDIASYCAAGVDLFFEMSKLRPLIPMDEPKIDENDMPEEFKESQREIKKMREAKKKKQNKKNAKRSNKHK
eukprot:CAMPEP_0194028692 /NCGR_PEP_ID=MMETSP0009_2-20130614/2600_1 /TAXON_ID=210454 /ORGANISM="Grammatophora oceanica, Strain CCMP 410" /LENGTH=421 /DNA_ID=CAMNT_0038668153 /DNA_START=30 /DNA_END=1295 /DNA_ORIENTATION=-